MHSLLMIALAAGAAHAAEISVADRGHAMNPQFSPDGSQVAFEVNNMSGKVDLYVSKLSSGNPVGTPSKVALPGASSSFSGGGSVAAAPNWHPDGALIFEGSNSGGTMRLYFWQPGGAAAAELLSSGQASGDLSWPSISKDGQTVAFVSDMTGAGDIYLWNRATNAVEKTVGSPFSEMAPRFNAAGSEFAYSRKNNGTEDLFTHSGTNSTPRIGGNGDQSRPVYAGDTVVYFSNERGDDHWDIATSTGPGNKKTIAKDVRLPMRATPALSPDGQWVAWGSSVPAKAGSIYLTNVATGQTTSIATGLVATGEPALASAGGRTYLAFTALPSEGADWRSLHVIDVTGKY
jgi:Tol biopolymer transport system component